jgi:deazaflavin-dependent oxidoreductase (nitroreductase family)
LNPYAALVRALGGTRAFAWFGRRTFDHLDRPFRGRKRAVSSLGTGLPLCFLTVAGRRTGRPRTVPLLHVADGERVVLFGSNWGGSSDPAWALNLDAADEATITVGSAERRMHPRRATPEETARYWPQAESFWPAYAAYRRRAGREVPVFVLEPTG